MGIAYACSANANLSQWERVKLAMVTDQAAAAAVEQ